MTELHVFQDYGKIPRWANEHVWVSEKIDGSNSAVVIERQEEQRETDAVVRYVYVDDVAYVVRAQSRKRFLLPGKQTDNFGFAQYVFDNAEALVKTLGVGRHYGEYWGSGIQRGYGMVNGERWFSLFPTSRVSRSFQNYHDILTVPQLNIVPELYSGPWSGNVIEDCLDVLRDHGTFASNGAGQAEGVVVTFKLSGARYKAFVNDDGVPKSLKEKE